MHPRVAALAVLLLLLPSCHPAILPSLVGGQGNRRRLPSFHTLALAAGTDKVTRHSYHHMYDRYLPPYRGLPINMLEIGLGCDMDYGPGKSVKVWYEYFTHFNTTIDFLETNGTCAEKFHATSTRGKFLVGDQGEVEHLQRVIDRAQEIGGYDIIIDDGGHFMKQQLLTFEKLWPVVRPGGMHVIEDMETSYMEHFGGGPVGKPGTAIAWVKSVIDSLNCRRQETDSAPCIFGLVSVSCFEDACVFMKAFQRDS